MTRTLLTGLLLSAWYPFTPLRTPETRTQDTHAPPPRFELRTYYTNDGKLTDLHKRFRDHTCRLLKQHGAESDRFRTPLDEKGRRGAS